MLRPACSSSGNARVHCMGVNIPRIGVSLSQWTKCKLKQLNELKHTKFSHNPASINPAPITHASHEEPIVNPGGGPDF